MNKFMLFCLIGIVISSIILVSALTTEEQDALQNELNNLTSGLDNQGYGWLVNTITTKLINYDNLMLSNDIKILTY